MNACGPLKADAGVRASHGCHAGSGKHEATYIEGQQTDVPVAAAPEGDRVTGKRIGLWLLIAFLIFFIVTSPADAAAVTKNIQHLLGHLFDGAVKFIDSFRS